MNKIKRVLSLLDDDDILEIIKCVKKIPMTISQIAELTHIPQGTLYRKVDKLCDKNDTKGKDHINFLKATKIIIKIDDEDELGPPEYEYCRVEEYPITITGNGVKIIIG